MRRLSAYHPLVSAVYFISVLIVTMFASHPWLLLCALAGGVLLSAMLCRPRLREYGGYLLLFVLVSLTNPLFSHNGATPLFFLNNAPVTLEAVLYGVYMAGMLVAVLQWFKSFQTVMTADKLLFLFGKASPKLSLLLSSALRFIPLLRTQADKIRRAQTAMGLFASDTWLDKLRGTLRVYSALITWALENAMDTGASMKARGYGLKGRSHYALYRFTWSDAVMLCVIAALDAVLLAAMATGQLTFAFYPTLTASPVTPLSAVACAAFAVLSMLPSAGEIKEGLQWTYYVSKM